MSTVEGIGITYVQGARVDIEGWPLKPEVIEILSAAISMEIDFLRERTGQHAIVVEVYGSRMQITSEEITSEDFSDSDYYDDLDGVASTSIHWHAIMLSPGIRRRLQELALPTRYDRSDPV